MHLLFKTYSNFTTALGKKKSGLDLSSSKFAT
jgi:hypothetical protein